MPFQITTQPFGPLPTGAVPLTEYLLENTDTGEFIAVIPEYGAILRRLVLRKGEHLVSLLRTPESPSALLADETYASALLYPFPSRIRHGIYAFDGEEYALPMNEVSRNHALHGFVSNKPFVVVGQETTDSHARLTLNYQYLGDLTGYPFPFGLSVTYELALGSTLRFGRDTDTDKFCAMRMHYSAMNTGKTPCPAAFGWHPYFSITTEDGPALPIDEMTLDLPVEAAVTLDEAMIPTGQHQPHAQRGPFALKDRQFDTPFVVRPTGEGFAETVLNVTKHGLWVLLGQETGPDKLNYIVCYTPYRRDSIAIEPQTANVNAFNTGEGLARLNPGDALSGTIWVRLE